MKKSLITGLVAAVACLLGCKLFMGMMMFKFSSLLCALFTGGVVFVYCKYICKCNSDMSKCDSKKKKK